MVGLGSVESCCSRLTGVARSIEARCGASLLAPGLPGGDENATAPGACGNSTPVARILAGLSAVLEEMFACAEAIEVAAEVQLGHPASGDLRWSADPQEHYPELLAVELPSHRSVPEGPTGMDPAVLTDRWRLQVGAVKDRYSTVLPGLRWVGPERDEFTGRRLTLVRSGLEAVEDDLRLATLETRVVDLTDKVCGQEAQAPDLALELG